MSEAKLRLVIDGVQSVVGGLDRVEDGLGAVNTSAQRTAAGMSRIGKSSRETAAAMRGLPAQFTDIFTSLQAGQSPLTVLLQQGGQLKDMFGGVGPAASAMAGYVLGLVNPFTLAAGAAGALALAYYQGSEEADAFTKALAMNGNATGVAVAQLHDMAEAVSDVIGTEGEAADALAQLAGTGRVAGENLEYFARVAMQLERTVGQSVSATAEDLSALGKAPVEASERLNEKYRYLTAAVYDQIRALEEQGRVEEAGALAQKTYAAAFEKRTQEITSNLGSIERAYQASIGTIKRWWDAVLAVGRPATMSDFAADIEAAREKLERAQKFVRPGDRQSQIAVDWAQKELDALLAKQAALEKQQRTEAAVAKEEAERLKVEQALTLWKKEGIKYLSATAREEREIAQARQQGADAGIAVQEIEARVAEIRKKYAGSTRERGVNKEATAYANLIASIKAKTEENRLFLASEEGLTESQKIRIKLDQDLAAGKIRLTAAHQAEIAKSLEALGVTEQVIADNQAMFKSAQEFETLYERLAAERDKLYEQVSVQQEYNEKLGLTTEQVIALDAAKLEEQATSKERIATLMDEIDWSGKLGEVYRQQADALRERADEMRQGGLRQKFVDGQQKIADQAKQVWDEFGDNVQRNLGDNLYGAMRGEFDNIGDAWASMLQRMIADAMAADLRSLLSGGSGGNLSALFGGFGNFLGSFLGGGTGVGIGEGLGGQSIVEAGMGLIGAGRAAGGPVYRNTMHPVNERGPELLSIGDQDFLMMGNRSGHVTPNHKLGGGKSVSVTVQQTNHFQSGYDRARLQGDMARLKEATRAEIMDELRREGVV